MATEPRRLFAVSTKITFVAVSIADTFAAIHFGGSTLAAAHEPRRGYQPSGEAPNLAAERRFHRGTVRKPNRPL